MILTALVHEQRCTAHRCRDSSAEPEGGWPLIERPSELLERYRSEILALAAKHHALEVWVFGSVARDEDRPGSDLDLLVRFADDASLLDLSALSDDIRELLGIGVDVVSEAGLDDRHAAIRAEARRI